MHAVRCPQCKCLLSMDRPLVKARLECRNCGAVFIASTQWLEGAPSGVGAGRDEMHMYHSPGRKPAPHWPIFVVAFGTAAIVLIVVGIWYFANYTRVEVKTPDGQVEYSARMTRDEARRLREELKRRSSRARKVATLPPEVPQARNAASAPGKAPDLMPGGEEWRRMGGGASAARRVGLAVPAKSDPKIKIILSGRLRRPGPGGCVTGLARNKYDVPLRRIDITVVAFDSDDRPLAVLPATTCHYVPAGQAIAFCVEYTSIPSQQVARLEGFASATKAADREVYWRIDPLNCQTEIRGSTYILKGRTRNLSGKAVRDARVYCDFFDADGLIVGSAVGSLDDGKTRIGAGEHAFFTVEFDAAGKQTLPQVIERFAPRMIAREF